MLKATNAREIAGSLRSLKVVAAREFLDNLLNLRFITGLVLCLVVTVACIAILAHNYRSELADYSRRVNMQDDFLSHYATRDALVVTNRQQKPPERFRPLIVGIPPDEALKSFDDNPLSILFPPLDLLFIVTIVMTVLALLFSYDAVTGERQRGTLRLVISNSVSRTTILLGKFLGGTASLLIPFLLALLVGVLYINLNPSIQWTASAWAELGLLAVASITFVTLFYLLGLTVSTFSRYSAVSILNCLFVWVLLILAIPNLAPYISAQVYHIPSINEMERRFEEMERDSLKLAGQRNAEVTKDFQRRYGKLFAELEAMGDAGSGRQKAVQQRAATDPEFRAMMEAFREAQLQATQPIFAARTEAKNRLRQDLETQAARQTKLAKVLACISPLADFTYVARDLTGTGLLALEHFERISGSYEREVINYAAKKVQEGRQKDPTLGRDSLIDLSNRPRFVFKEESLKDKLGEVLPYWGILGLFNVVFFAAAFAGFMRYDVR
jgi:ABC-type transport system involved in multi-copper enzyme maturation permease subunit